MKEPVEDESDDDNNVDPVKLVFHRFNKIPIPIPKPKQAKKSPEIIYPKNVMLIDEAPKQQLKRPYIYSYVKRSRNLGSLIICSQFFNDLDNSTRNQFTHLILIGGIGDQKLNQIHDEFSANMPFDEFKGLYKYCASFKYGFITLSDRGELRRNLNKILKI